LLEIRRMRLEIDPTGCTPVWGKATL